MLKKPLHLACVLLVAAAVAGASLVPPALAQSPNTATIVVLVADQTGGAVPDATVSAINSQTGLRREAAQRCARLDLPVSRG